MFDVIALRARQHECRARLVVVHGEMEVLHRNFACSPATAGGKGPALRRPPGECVDVDFVLMLICLRFPLYAIDFQEIIYCCHNVWFLRALCLVFSHSTTTYAYAGTVHRGG